MSHIGDYSRYRYELLSRIWRRKLLVPSFLLGVALASAVLAAEGSQLWEQSVFESNKSSVVFINGAATRTNDLIDPFTGTGFIVHSDGFVLTCNHVIPKEEAPYKSVVATGSVGGRSEYPQPLQVILRDEQLDLALLKLPKRASRWRSVESAAQGTNGSRVLVLGFPLDENLLGEPGSITGTDGKGGKWLTNAAIKRGMSGGPVFDQSGAVIAVAAAGSEKAQGLNLVIPISFARVILDSVDVDSPLFRTGGTIVNTMVSKSGRGTGVEPKLPAASAAPAAATTDACRDVRIMKPPGTHSRPDAPAFQIPRHVILSWEPSDCVMVVQYYQGNSLRGEWKQQRSGSRFDFGELGGETEIKIWRDPPGVIADSLWVWVQDE